MQRVALHTVLPPWHTLSQLPKTELEWFPDSDDNAFTRALRISNCAFA